MLKPIRGGWIIELTDGREVARFTGPAAKRRALRYLASHNILGKAGDSALRLLAPARFLNRSQVRW
jgi:hypothetical protein